MAIRFKNLYNEDPFGFRKFHLSFQAETHDGKLESGAEALEQKQEAARKKVGESNLETETTKELLALINNDFTKKLEEHLDNTLDTLKNIEDLKDEGDSKGYKAVLKKFNEYLKKDKGALTKAHDKEILDLRYEKISEIIVHETKLARQKSFAHIFLKKNGKRLTDFTSTPDTYNIDFGGAGTQADRKISLGDIFDTGTTVKTLTVIHKGKKIEGYRSEDGVFYKLAANGSTTTSKLYIRHGDKVRVHANEVVKADEKLMDQAIQEATAGTPTYKRRSTEIGSEGPSLARASLPTELLPFADHAGHTSSNMAPKTTPEPVSGAPSAPRNFKTEARTRFTSTLEAEQIYKETLLGEALDSENGLNKETVVDLNDRFGGWEMKDFSERLKHLDYGREVLTALSELQAYSNSQSEIHLFSDLLKENGTVSYKRITWSLLRKSPRRVQKRYEKAKENGDKEMQAYYENLFIASQRLMKSLEKMGTVYEENKDVETTEINSETLEKRTLQKASGEISRNVERTLPNNFTSLDQLSPGFQDALEDLASINGKTAAALWASLYHASSTGKLNHESFIKGIDSTKSASDLRTSASEGNPEAKATILAVQRLMDELEKMERVRVANFLNSSFDLENTAPIVTPRFWDRLLKREKKQELDMQWFEGRTPKDIDTMNKSISDETAWLFLQDEAMHFSPETGAEVIHDLEAFRTQIIKLIKDGQSAYQGTKYSSELYNGDGTHKDLDIDDKSLEELTNLMGSNPMFKELFRQGTAEKISQEYMRERREEDEFVTANSEYGSPKQKALLEKFDELGIHLTKEQLEEVAQNLHEFDLAVAGIFLTAMENGEIDLTGWGIDFNVPIPLLSEPLIELHAGLSNGVFKEEVSLHGFGKYTKEGIVETERFSLDGNAGVGMVNGLPGLEGGLQGNLELGRYDQTKLYAGGGAGVNIKLGYNFFVNAGLERQFEGAIMRRTNKLYQENKERIEGGKEKYEARTRLTAQALVATGAIPQSEVEEYVNDAVRAANDFMIKEFGDKAYRNFGKWPVKFKGIGVTYTWIKIKDKEMIKLPIFYIKGGIVGKSFRVFRKPANAVDMSIIGEKRIQDDIERQLERDDSRNPHKENVSTYTYSFEGGEPVMDPETGKMSLTAPTETSSQSNVVVNKSALDQINSELKPSGVYLEQIESGTESKYRLHIEGVQGSISQFTDPAANIETYIGDDGHIYVNLNEGDTLSVRRVREYKGFKEFGEIRSETILISDNIHTPNKAITDTSAACISYSVKNDDSSGLKQNEARIIKIRDGLNSNVYGSEAEFKDAVNKSTTGLLEIGDIDLEGDGERERRKSLQGEYKKLSFIRSGTEALTLNAGDKTAIDGFATEFMNNKGNAKKYKELSTVDYNDLSTMNFKEQVELAKGILNANSYKIDGATIRYTIQKLFEKSMKNTNENNPEQIKKIMDWNQKALEKVLSERGASPEAAKRISTKIMESFKREALARIEDASTKPITYSTIKEGSTVQIQAGSDGIEGHREVSWADDGRMKYYTELTVEAVRGIISNPADAQLFVNIMLDRSDPLNKETPFKLFDSQLGQKILQAAPYYLPLEMAEDLLPIIKKAKDNPSADFASLELSGAEKALYEQFYEILTALRTNATYTGEYKGETFTVKIDQEKGFGFYEKCFNFTTELYERDPILEKETEISINSASAFADTVDVLESSEARNVYNVGIAAGLGKEEDKKKDHSSEKEAGGDWSSDKPDLSNGLDRPRVYENDADIGSGGTPTS